MTQPIDSPRRARVGQVHLDLRSRAEVLDRLEVAIRDRRPLAVVSANLDHLHHFAGPDPILPTGVVDGIEWWTLLDGHPFGAAVRRRFGPAAADLHPGSALLPPIVRVAAAAHARVALVGGSDDLRASWSAALARNYPDVVDAGTRRVDWAWLDRPGSGAELAAWVAARRADVVVVCLGKPRQELWLRDHGAATGADLLLAFGSAAEYIAGTARRPPTWASRHGLEWLVRLLREPRRLWRRYLVNGPGSYLLLRRGLAVDDER